MNSCCCGGAGRETGDEQGKKTREPPGLCRAGTWGQPGAAQAASGGDSDSGSGSARPLQHIPVPHQAGQNPRGGPQGHGILIFFRFFFPFSPSVFAVSRSFLSAHPSLPLLPFFQGTLEDSSVLPKPHSSLKLVLQGGQEDPDCV